MNRTAIGAFRVVRGLILVVALAAAGCGGAAPLIETPTPPPVAPTAAATPTATAPSSPTAAATPRVLVTVVPTTNATAQLARVEETVRRIRGRGVDRVVQRTFVTAEGMRAVIDRELEDPETIEHLRAEGALLEALGLLPAGTDILEAYRGLLGSQVVGLYDPSEKSLFVTAVEAEEMGPLELSVYAHEYQHALQDQRFDLDSLDRKTRGNRDASMAASALIEGDAVLTQSQYVAQEFGSAGGLALAAGARNVAPPTGPPVLIDLLQFPYLQGARFAQAAVRRSGLPAVDAAFGRLPASTEQILHPEKYVALEAPVEVTVEPVLPPGWSAGANDVLGEFLLQLWLRKAGARSESAAVAAAGWGGDRFVALRGPAGEHALVARLAWDTPLDADEFLTTLAPAPPVEGVRSVSVGGRWVALARFEQSGVVFATATDRARAIELVRPLARP